MTLITHFLFVLSQYFEGYPRLASVFLKTRPPRRQEQSGNHIYRPGNTLRTRQWISVKENWTGEGAENRTRARAHAPYHKDGGTWAQCLSAS